jgi:hypothetical protein
MLLFRSLHVGGQSVDPERQKLDVPAVLIFAPPGKAAHRNNLPRIAAGRHEYLPLEIVEVQRPKLESIGSHFEQRLSFRPTQRLKRDCLARIQSSLRRNPRLSRDVAVTIRQAPGP